MTREGHVRFWERAGVGFLRATRQVFIRIQGVQHYLWRAVDQNGSCSTSSFRPDAMPMPRSASSGGF